MGTNFYLFSRDRDLVKEHFDGEYELVDEPDLGYMIHINKLSCGWLPLFQKHEAFSTFNELIAFLDLHRDVEIFDEYGNGYTIGRYVDRVIDHTKQERRPYRWAYRHDRFSTNPDWPNWYLDPCNESEAEIFTPFRHSEYAETYARACASRNMTCAAYITNDADKFAPDPDYPLDWVEGEFS